MQGPVLRRSSCLTPSVLPNYGHGLLFGLGSPSLVNPKSREPVQTRLGPRDSLGSSWSRRIGSDGARGRTRLVVVDRSIAIVVEAVANLRGARIDGRIRIITIPFRTQPRRTTHRRPCRCTERRPSERRRPRAGTQPVADTSLRSQVLRSVSKSVPQSGFPGSVTTAPKVSSPITASTREACTRRPHRPSARPARPAITAPNTSLVQWTSESTRWSAISVDRLYRVPVGHFFFHSSDTLEAKANSRRSRGRVRVRPSSRPRSWCGSAP